MEVKPGPSSIRYITMPLEYSIYSAHGREKGEGQGHVTVTGISDDGRASIRRPDVGYSYT